MIFDIHGSRLSLIYASSLSTWIFSQSIRQEFPLVSCSHIRVDSWVLYYVEKTHVWKLFDWINITFGPQAWFDLSISCEITICDKILCDVMQHQSERGGKRLELNSIIFCFKLWNLQNHTFIGVLFYDAKTGASCHWKSSLKHHKVPLCDHKCSQRIAFEW